MERFSYDENWLYVAGQWWALSEWLRTHTDDPLLVAVREFLDGGTRTHLEYQRR